MGTENRSAILGFEFSGKMSYAFDYVNALNPAATLAGSETRRFVMI